MIHDGYEALVAYDDDAQRLHGEVVNVRDVITFQGKARSERKLAFAESVADYRELSRERGEEPEKPYAAANVP